MSATPAITWRPTLLRLGRFYLDAGCMFGLIPKVVWSRWFPPTPDAGGIDALNRMPLQTNSLLLESSDGRLAIVEVGIGDKLPPKEQGIYSQELTPAGKPRAVYDALAEVNARPQDISDVIVTHLHFDHAGGLTRLGAAGPDSSPELTFPNATIHVQEQELQDALANRSTMHKTYLPNHLTPQMQERVRAVRGEREVLPGISVFLTPGHTWGQQCVKIATPKGPVVFVSDVMPTRLHARPTCNLSYDVEPYTSMLTRTALLERAAAERWTLVLDHEPGDPVCAVERQDGGGHRLAPAAL